MSGYMAMVDGRVIAAGYKTLQTATAALRAQMRSGWSDAPIDGSVLDAAGVPVAQFRRAAGPAGQAIERVRLEVAR